MRSKRRSAAKPKRRRKPTYYIDESLGLGIAGALGADGWKVVPHANLFPSGADDQEWATTIGRRGYVALTKDSSMRGRPNERNAIRMARLKMFALCSGSIRAEVMLTAFRRARRAMEELIATRDGPFVARVDAAGRITKVAQYTDRGWRESKPIAAARRRRKRRR